MEAVKKIARVLSVAVLLMFFAACAEEQKGGAFTAYTPREIAEAIIAAQAEIAPLNVLSPDDEFFWEYLAEQFHISQTEISDGIIFYAGGVIVDEIAVLVLACESDAPAVQELLSQYANRRRVIFASYAPVQAGILANSIAATSGNHVALLITEDPQSAEATFFALFGDTPPPPAPETAEKEPPAYIYEETPPAEEPAPPTRDRYNSESILLAWESGDRSNLSPLNASVLEKSEYVLNSIITDDMDEMEKKFAALRWIIVNSVYDPEFLCNSPTAAPNPNNDNPYGILADGVAICFGFAYTFQLFMDLLGIESMLVYGYDFTYGRHVWNLVHIDGIWSAVDPTLEVTLNNPLGVEIGFVPEEVVHRHVNLSCDYLYYERGHMWDRDSVPVAVGR